MDIFGLGTLGAAGIQAASSAYQMQAQQQMHMQDQNYNWNVTQWQNAQNQQEAERARQFNSAEAAIGRDFSAGQAHHTRMFNMTEAEKQRNFASGEAGIARDYNTKEAETARKWSEMMSNTAYQRSMEDMKAAGLNPILAYQKGGASSPGSPAASTSAPGGSSASSSAPGGPSASGPAAHGSALGSPSSPALPSIMQNAVSSAIEWERTKPQIELMKQQEKVAQEDEHLRRATAKRETTAAAVNLANADNIRQNIEIGERESKRSQQHDVPFYQSKVGEWSRWLGNIGREVVPFSNNARSIQQMIDPK